MVFISILNNFHFSMTPEQLSGLFFQLLEGSKLTLAVFFITLIFSLPLGLLFAVGRLSRFWILRKPIEWLIIIIRGTPLMLQIIIAYFAPYYIFGLNYDRFIAANVAFSINYAAYFAEIYRGGILSVPVGQYEAGKVLGFNKGQIFFKITFPQVIKKILPPISNEVITLIKDTALVQIIGIRELFRVAQTSSSALALTTPLFIAGAFYLVMNFIISKIFAYVEMKFSYYK